MKIASIFCVAVVFSIWAEPSVRAQTDWTFIQYSKDPILSPQQGYRAVYSPSVIKEDGIYKMWFTMADSVHDQTAYATSEDGIHWRNHGIVFPHGVYDKDFYRSTKYTTCQKPGRADMWDCLHAGDPEVIKVKGMYYLYYTGSFDPKGTASIGLATATDGIHWTKYSGNPILTPGNFYDSYWLQTPSVIYDNETWKMWYSAKEEAQTPDRRQSRIAYATSSDGIHWTKVGIALQKGVTSAWDYVGVNSPTVVKYKDKYIMVYGHSGQNGVGIALSDDGIYWEKSRGNPILKASGEGWNSRIISPHLLLDAVGFKLYYGGGDISVKPCCPWKIGLATMPF